MTNNWPPLDTHAHVDVAIDSAELLDLRAVIFAVTRSLTEARQALRRQDDDPLTVWGVGVHPALATATRDYEESTFQALAAEAALVGEIGLDGLAATPLEQQQKVLSSILSILQAHPRPTSVHSAGATEEVLEHLTDTPCKGIILHWWLGDQRTTERAVDLGAYFSVNTSSSRRPATLNHIPLDRLLLETDHPDGNRHAPSPRRPGAVETVEVALSSRYGLTPTELRATAWRNLAQLVTDTNSIDLFPSRVASMLRVARPPD